MPSRPRIRRTTRLFIDSEDCAEGPCVVTQMVVNVVLFANGTAEVVVSDPENPSRSIRRNLDEQTQAVMVRFLDMAPLLGAPSAMPGT